MGFLKGILNFILMIVLAVCLMVWFGYGLFDASVLSFDENQKMIEQTEFTEEVTSEILSRYNTKLTDLSVDDDVLLNFVNESGLGVMGYIFSEYDEMPSVDVTFLKDYVIRDVAVMEAGKLYGNVDFNDLIAALRMIPEGESVTNNFESYLDENNLSVHQEDVDQVIKLYLENKDLDDQALIDKIIGEMAYEKLNVDQMSTDLSLQSLFDSLTDRNPFTLVRDLLNHVKRNVYGYITITMVVVVLMILVSEFRVSTFSVWMSLAFLLAIIPLQAIRLVDFLVDRNYFDLINGMESYKNYMLDVMIQKLNVYTIITLVLIVVLFILSKIISKRVDSKIEGLEEKRSRPYALVRFAIFLVLALGLFLNVKGMYRYNMQVVNEIQAISPDDFDPNDLDVTLSNLLNIDYDF
ncbi:hypothetical protein EZV73_04405 [Acidaminobacter sp. JC074]|uniref:hypothetical protein n=1 Tax=Acidaminobacter sp. JC074 TaxID=2530199 RepID=UPI001F0D3727|nr:hypothetical protein [Acidaminobacter sp. JC074]MCH4886795.1 hypothetical protein [Acidaminobacter sp. JC074]